MQLAMEALPPPKAIPAAFTASVRSWWHTGEKEASIAEERLLRRLPFFRPASSAPHTHDAPPVVATSSTVTLDTPGQYINTLSLKATAPRVDAPPPVVMLHGYGAGLGFFFKNFPPLANWAARKGTNVHAIDWLGMGRSARVPFTVKAKRDDVERRVAEAESFFVDSLEEWRKKMGIDRMTLIAHSLGGYFSVVYALRYPDRVHKLILLSPAGVPRGPDYTEPSRELNDEGPNPDGQPPSRGGAERSTFQRASRNRMETLREEQRQTKQRESKGRRLFTYLWEEGWSPFQVVRSSFVWAPMLVGKYTSRRFPSLDEEETKEMHEYLLNITLAKGSGEYCISHILAPGAHARLPLVDRVHALRTTLPVTFVYGHHDWMDPVGALQAVKSMEENGNPNGKVLFVSNAGHHLYLDNVEETNRLLLKELNA